jgi:hypothetical protein
MRIKAVTWLWLSLAFSLVPGPVRADPVRILGGFQTGGQEGDSWRFIGSTFALSADGFDLWIPKNFAPTCMVPGRDERCLPGEVLNVSFTTPAGSFLGSGAGTINGTPHSSLSFHGSLAFESEPIQLPATTDGMDVILPGQDGSGFLYLSSPFSFTGSVRALDGDEEVFARMLAGSGVALMPFYFYPPNGSDAGGWFSEEGFIAYQFKEDDPAPTPEPGTLLLVGLGVGAIARTRGRLRGRKQ